MSFEKLECFGWGNAGLRGIIINDSVEEDGDIAILD